MLSATEVARLALSRPIFGTGSRDSSPPVAQRAELASSSTATRQLLDRLATPGRAKMAARRSRLAISIVASPLLPARR